MSTRQVEREMHQTTAVAPVRAAFTTPWGDGIATVSDGRLIGVELPVVRRGVAVRPSGEVAEGDVQCVGKWVSELEAYFRGERLSWPYAAVAAETRHLTPFGRHTIECLMSVPAGSAVSYGSLAALAGYPRAARAVGSLMANNPIPIVIPCHRVIRSDGSLGRYGDDPSWKERLLTHENHYEGDRRDL